MYTLQSETAVASFMNIGATLVEFLVPNKNKSKTNVCLGLTDAETYIKHRQYYLGCVCGRCANRIARGKFEIDGKAYQLATNLGAHHLHGGIDGFNIKYWEAEYEASKNEISFKYKSIDGEEGYPGTVELKVTYTLSKSDLKMSFEATTDKATPLTLTNHSYFNLSGEPTIKNHSLQISSTQLMVVDNDLIPSGEFKNVANTLYDFTKPVLLSKYYEHIDLFDNSWLLSKPHDQLQKAGTVFSEVTGISLTCFTSFPSIHFYDGHFLDHPFSSKQGLCLEAQFLPDSVNQKNFPDALLKPGETYKHAIVYQFDVIEQ